MGSLPNIVKESGSIWVIVDQLTKSAHFIPIKTGVGRALKSNKLTPYFNGLYQIIEKIGEVAYRIALPPSLSNLHNVFCNAHTKRI